MDAVELTRQLVRIPTVGADGQVGRCQALLADILLDHGFTVDRHVMDDGGINLVARYGSQAARPLCLSGHVDTVPLGETPWDVDPFGAGLADGKIFGRGTSDMKAGVAAFVAAACRHARGGSGAPILIVLTTAEETGCRGACSLVAARSLEPAQLLLVAEPTRNTVAAGHKGAQWLTVRVRGVAAHGSMPHLGENAALKAAARLRVLEDALVPRHTDHPLGFPTVNVGFLRAGTYINAVPDLAEIGLDLRSIPGASLLEEAIRALGPDAETETILDLPPVWTDPEDPGFRKAAAIIQSIRPDSDRAPRGVSYFTDASIQVLN